MRGTIVAGVTVGGVGLAARRLLVEGAYHFQKSCGAPL